MAASITAHLQIFKLPQLPHFSTDFDETDIKIHGLLRSFILNIVIIRVAVPFKEYIYFNYLYTPLENQEITCVLILSCGKDKYTSDLSILCP